MATESPKSSAALTKWGTVGCAGSIGHRMPCLIGSLLLPRPQASPPVPVRAGQDGGAHKADEAEPHRDAPVRRQVWILEPRCRERPRGYRVPSHGDGASPGAIARRSHQPAVAARRCATRLGQQGDPTTIPRIRAGSARPGLAFDAKRRQRVRVTCRRHEST
jgi:hypothetical protein